MAKKEVLKKSTLLKKTIPYIKKEKWLFLLTILLTLVTAGINAITPFITKKILDVFFNYNAIDI